MLKEWDIKRHTLESDKYIFTTGFKSVFWVIIGLSFWLIGTRPLTVGFDTYNYYSIYHQFESNIGKFEIGYENLSYLFSNYLEWSFHTFLIALSFLTLGLTVKIIYKVFSLSKQTLSFFSLLLLTLSFCYLSPIYFSLTCNVMRQGIATLLVLWVAINIVEAKHLFVVFVLSCIAVSFHKTSGLFIFSCLLLRLPYNVLFKLSVGGLLCYCFGLTAKALALGSIISGLDLYSPITDYSKFSGYNSGLRYDFAFFSLVAGLLFHWLRKEKSIRSNQYVIENMLKIYWVLLLPFSIFGFGAYSDRFLLPAWAFLSFLAALVIGYILQNYRNARGLELLGFIFSTGYFVSLVQGGI